MGALFVLRQICVFDCVWFLTNCWLIWWRRNAQGHCGNGSALFVNTTTVTSSAVAVGKMQAMQTVLAPRSVDGGGSVGSAGVGAGTTTVWEVSMWCANASSADASVRTATTTETRGGENVGSGESNRLVVHFTNVTATTGSSAYGTLKLAIKLPPGLLVRCLSLYHGFCQQP
jgi:hypothetical protein